MMGDAEIVDVTGRESLCDGRRGCVGHTGEMCVTVE